MNQSPNAQLLQQLGFQEVSDFWKGDLSFLDPMTGEPQRRLEGEDKFAALIVCPSLDTQAHHRKNKEFFQFFTNASTSGFKSTGAFDHGHYWIARDHVPIPGFAQLPSLELRPK